MITNIDREKRRVQILTTISIVFALSFLGSFISQTVKLARLEGWRTELETDITLLERQRIELEEQIALRDTDAWLSQAAIEAGYLPPNAYAVVVQDQVVATAQAAPPDGLAAPEEPLSEGAVELALWNNANWRAWRRLLIGRP